MKNEYYVPFTAEMKKDYTILVPNMLPMHFKLMAGVLGNYGWHLELLETAGREIADIGLKYTHNDTCYPAVLVIGQFIHALQSGKYDVNKVALIMFQTGGGCRASNYISLIRKALARAGFGQVPVISMSLSGIERHPGFRLTVPIYQRIVYAILYGDLLMSLVNQCRPYECEAGRAEALAEHWVARIAEGMKKQKNLSYRHVRQEFVAITESFAAIERRSERRVRVGVVGEIFVKYSPLANNHLCDFLVAEGAEPVVPGLLDFVLFVLYNNVDNCHRYGGGLLKRAFNGAFLSYMQKKQKELIAIQKQGGFRTLTPFSHTVTLAEGYIDTGVKMGEGWLLTAEMLELAGSGVPNIVCTQPFGCLPNHICGKGMMKRIRERNPGVNVVAIDYDSGMSVVNQENRIKLMLSNARELLRAETEREEPAKTATAVARETVCV